MYITSEMSKNKLLNETMKYQMSRVDYKKQSMSCHELFYFSCHYVSMSHVDISSVPCGVGE